MRAIGLELLQGTSRNLKFILGDSMILFFPGSQQHREIKMEGLSYEDDYRGNAVAGLITSDHVEIRFHKAYSDDRLRAIWSHVLAIPEVAAAGLGGVYYQGRRL